MSKGRSSPSELICRYVLIRNHTWPAVDIRLLQDTSHKASIHACTRPRQLSECNFNAVYVYLFCQLASDLISAMALCYPHTQYQPLIPTRQDGKSFMPCPASLRYTLGQSISLPIGIGLISSCFQLDQS